MHFAVDGSWTRWTTVGIGRYQAGLLHALGRRLETGDSMAVLYNSRSGRTRYEPPVVERFIRLPNRTLWNQVRIPLELRTGFDAYLATGIVGPVLTRVPTIAVIHDCLAFRDPSSKSPSDRRYWTRWTRATASRAAALVAVSQFVAEDCQRFLGVNKADVSVVYQGVHQMFSETPHPEPTRASLIERFGITTPYVLQVGAYDPHKGGAVALEAMKRLRHSGRDLMLVQCGQGRGHAPSARDAVVHLGHVDDPTLVDLYRCAAAVCVTSTHEGFGLPVVEAMACGAPVVASRAAALPEAGGDIATYVPPNDADALARALAGLLDESAVASRRRRAAGVRWARRFSWDDSAAQMLEIVRRVAARPPAS